ncbi:MAG: LytTR family DNA-binding domain-containing protein [Steroidobacteraceae bacterium]|jgi:two-component system LytT family response regulator|nr:LytTR family DNA-binding domain-containing protein [Steroidobacteraceae bacterium]
MDVIIVDDEPAARRTLRECCAAEQDLRVVGEFGDGRVALEAIRARPPALLFLDIQMDTMNGLEIARSLEPATLPAIVFVTAYDHYALEAFEVNATDYLLKPFDEARFRRTLERVRARRVAPPAERQAALDAVLSQLERLARPPVDRRPRLLAESNGALHMLDVADIELVESDRNYVRIRVGRDVYHARSTLAQAEQALAGETMLRISRSCLVNVAHVREVSRTPRGDFILVLAGGATVTSSEGYRERVRDYFERLRL